MNGPVLQVALWTRKIPIPYGISFKKDLRTSACIFKSRVPVSQGPLETMSYPSGSHGNWRRCASIKQHLKVSSLTGGAVDEWKSHWSIL